MAGAGYKLFNTGDVLTAAQVNTYLQEQSVMVFASSAARTSALSAVLAEGMMSYLQDTNAVQVYNGSSWVAVGGSSPLTTKGDVYTFSTVDARLGVGANGTVLTADSAEATGLKWATPAAGGGMTLINTGGTALTGASVTVSSIPGTYKHLYVIMEDVYQATTAGGIKMRFNSDTGSNYTFSGVRNINTTLAGTSSTTTSIQLETRTGSTNTANKKAQVQVWLPRYTNTTPKALHSQSYGHDDTNPSNFAVSATYVGGSAISSITVFGDYNFSGGTIYVYGVN